MNQESNLFIPVDLEHSRSTFHFTPTRSGTCHAGRLIPVLAMETLPGDSFNVGVNSLFKMSTPVYPTMDNLFADVFFFYVPYKLLLSRRYGSPSLNDGNQSWKAIIGAQDNLLNMPIPATGIRVPDCQADGTKVGSLADYFNVNVTGESNYFVSCLPYLAYASIWNENFRDPSTGTPVTWNFDNNNHVLFSGYVGLMINTLEDVGSVITPGQNYGFANALDITSGIAVTDRVSTNMYPFPVCRFHGYFGSALPWPQRNTDGVELPLGDAAPIVVGSDMLKADGSSDFLKVGGMKMAFWQGSYWSRLPTNSLLINDGVSNSIMGTGTQNDYSPSNYSVAPTNLYADLSEATAANVNALRMAIQQQRWYEKLARSGNRYDELKYGLFGVRGKDAGDDRPLYLGGKRIPLNIEMVASTDGGTSPGSAENLGSLGTLGAFSHTNDSDHYFYHSFDDWGVTMCLFTIRHHSTANGFHKVMWDRRIRDDFYFPTFAHLGESPVSLEALTGVSTSRATVFGYQQAWEEYRFEPDLVTGLVRPNKSLGFMTYAETFTGTSTLAGYLNASTQMRSIDQTLAVKSYSSGFQFVYQFNFDIVARRCLPVYSIPGLMDHF